MQLMSINVQLKSYLCINLSVSEYSVHIFYQIFYDMLFEFWIQQCGILHWGLDNGPVYVQFCG